MGDRERRGPAVALAVFYVLLTVGFDPGNHGGRT
jgi:hypothetical protein